MREKLLKKYNAIYIVYIVILAAALLAILFFKEQIKSYLIWIFVGIAIFSTLFISILHYFEINEDKKIINEMAFNGQMALAHIDSACFEKFVKDAVLKRYVIWKLDITYYDENYVGHKETIYEQFAPLQESVPQGNIYITYDPERPDYKFIIPNMLVGAFDSNKNLILGYEKKFKNMKYLNVYYNNGLIVETFAESLKKRNEEYKAKQEYQKAKEGTGEQE